MAFDRSLLAQKLKKYREQFQISSSDLSKFTGIAEKDINSYENEEKLPSGDEILILADFYKCDYKFFISNEKVAPFEQTETLFRRYGDQFSKNDRWAVQEILFLAECEVFFNDNLGTYRQERFTFIKKGNFFKNHGIEAANALRQQLGYADNAVPMDIYQDFRSIGIYVYRRCLENSNISGLCIKHPVAGKCILINYNEDIYRQRFTACHEAAHAILDEEDVVVSFTKWKKGDLVEIRANTFASHYLMPASFLKAIPKSDEWNANKAITWANKLKVSTEALGNALIGNGLIDKKSENLIKSVRVPKNLKSDPELSDALSSLQKIKKSELLKLGLSSSYVHKCLEAYNNNIISAGRMAEMLFTNENHLKQIAELYGENLKYGS